MRRERYLSKFDDWAWVYPNQYPDSPAGGFLEAYYTVRNHIHSMALPDEAAPQDFCDLITVELRTCRSEAEEAYDQIRMDIAKSFCLDRLIYMDEDLRTRPCPTHKGRWGFARECEHGCGDSGWLPNEVNDE